MKLSTVEAWLAYIGSVHQQEIELGLDRVKQVASRLHIDPGAATVVMVGGTNGKGSTVAGLEAIYRAAGFNVGAFTTPVLIRHNEEVRVNGIEASDADFINAFEAIEMARGEVSLTPFEYHALAAFYLLQRANLDVWLVEVGMGGRLDAVNILNADISVITSIDLDHMAWLGDTRELIAIEKAGIARAGRPVVVGERQAPETLEATLETIGAICYTQGKAFDYQTTEEDWSWQMKGGAYYSHLPRSVLLHENMSVVLAVVSLMQHKLFVREEAIRAGLATARLTGRLEVEAGEVERWWDVSHNPHAVLRLVEKLTQTPIAGRTLAVFSMLSDKDIKNCLRPLKGLIDEWFTAPLLTARGASASQLLATFEAVDITAVTMLPSIETAYAAAQAKAVAGDRLVIFGSFVTVAKVKQAQQFLKHAP